MLSINEFYVHIRKKSSILLYIDYSIIIRSKEKFRVYILLPLLTGYDDPNSVRTFLHLIMQSIAKSEKSLFKRLEAAGKT